MSEIDNDFMRRLLGDLHKDDIDGSPMKRMEEAAQRHNQALQDFDNEQKQKPSEDSPPIDLSNLFGKNRESVVTERPNLSQQLLNVHTPTPESTENNKPSGWPFVDNDSAKGHSSYLEDTTPIFDDLFKNRETPPSPDTAPIDIQEGSLPKGDLVTTAGPQVKVVPPQRPANNFKSLTDTDLDSRIKSLLVQNPEFKPLESSSQTPESILRDMAGLSLPDMSIDFSIKQLIEYNVTSPRINLLYSNINLQKNKENLQSVKQKYLSQLNSDYTDCSDKLDSLRDEAFYLIGEYESSVESHFSKQRESLIQGITSSYNDLKKYFHDLKENEVETAIAGNEDLASSIHALTESLNQLKVDVEKMFGKDKIESLSYDGFKMPETEEELIIMIGQVKDFLSDMKLDNESFYKNIIGGLLGILFYPTKLVEGELKTFVGILNLCLVLYGIYEFNNIFFFIVVCSIIIDLMYQMYMSHVVNRGLAKSLFLHDNALTIIQSFKDRQAMAIRSEHEEKYKSLLDKAKSNYDDSLGYISKRARSLTEDALAIFEEDSEYDRVKEVYEKTSELFDMKLERLRNEINIAHDKTLIEIDKQIAKNLEEMKKYITEDPIECPNKNKLSLEGFKIKVGDYTDLEQTTEISHSKEFKEGSYLVLYDSDDEKEEFVDMVKHAALQMLNYMRPEYMTVHLFDMNSFGRNVVDILSEEEHISKLHSTQDDLNLFLNETSVSLQRRIATALKTFKSVSQYNTALAARGAVTMDYLFNIFYDISPQTFKDVKFKAIMSEGGAVGLSSVAFLNNKELKPKGDNNEIDKELITSIEKFNFVIKKVNNKWNLTSQEKVKSSWEGAILPDIAHFNRKPLQYSSEKAVQKIKYLEEVLSKFQLDSIPYKDLMEKIVPDDKVWTFTTLKGIDLCIGYRDGDLTKPEFITLGDKPPHGLGAGKTGAGKSNKNNVMIMTAIRMYSPEWLNMIMVDFKNLEFNMYTGAASLPQTSVIAGTTDPEYSLSVFRHILKRMEWKKKVLSTGFHHNGGHRKFKNVEEWNTYLLKHDLVGTYDIMPRDLCFLDEFQIAFKGDNEDVKDELKLIIGRIASEARSMGIHWYFTSQSMDGTVSQNILDQIGMRVALSMTTQTSIEILRNPAASKLKRGFAYVTTDESGDPKSNILFRIPYIPTDFLVSEIIRMKEMVKGRTKIDHKAEFYDESVEHDHKELEVISSHERFKEEKPHTIVLGPKVVYKPTRNPETLTVGFEDYENIMITAAEKVEYANLINSTLVNFAAKPRTKILIACFDRAMDGMIRQDLADPDFQHFYKASNAQPLLELLNEYIIDPDDSAGSSSDIMPLTVNTVNDPTEFDPDNFDPDSYELFDASSPSSSDDNEPVEPFNPEVHDRIIVFFIGMQKARGFNEIYLPDEIGEPLKRLLTMGPNNGINTVMAIGESHLQRMAPSFLYRMTAKIGEDMSMNIYNNKSAKNLPPKFGLLYNATKNSYTKFKIYRFEYDAKYLSSDELEFELVV